MTTGKPAFRVQAGVDPHWLEETDATRSASGSER